MKPLVSFCFIAFAFTASAQDQNKAASRPIAESSCSLGYEKALEDEQNGKLKYYVAGIAAPSGGFIDSMERHYDLQVVSLGCTQALDHRCYNEYVVQYIARRSRLKS